jgi:hypothetical protein
LAPCLEASDLSCSTVVSSLTGLDGFWPLSTCVGFLVVLLVLFMGVYLAWIRRAGSWMAEAEWACSRRPRRLKGEVADR